MRCILHDQMCLNDKSELLSDTLGSLLVTKQKICTAEELNDNKIQIPYDKYHKVYSLVDYEQSRPSFA